MRTTIKQWGNSLALRLPKGIATKHELCEGSHVSFVERDDGVLIKKERQTRTSLKELVREITQDNTHHETG